MCIAIFKPEDARLTRAAAKNSFEHNSDGAGFAYAEGGVIHLKKGYFTFKKFWKDFRVAQERDTIVHFRIATHGKVCPENCHPFMVTDNLAMVHNGVLPIKTEKEANDSRTFADEWLAPELKRQDELMPSPLMTFLLGEFIGMNNKVILLNGAGEHSIVNEDYGDWDKGIWYSNSSYKPRKWESRTGYMGALGWQPGHSPGWQEKDAVTSRLKGTWEKEEEDLDKYETYWKEQESAREEKYGNDDDVADKVPVHKQLDAFVENERDSFGYPEQGEWRKKLPANEEVSLKWLNQGDLWEHSHFGIVTTTELSLIHSEQELSTLFIGGTL